MFRRSRAGGLNSKKNSEKPHEPHLCVSFFNQKNRNKPGQRCPTQVLAISTSSEMLSTPQKYESVGSIIPYIDRSVDPGPLDPWIGPRIRDKENAFQVKLKHLRSPKPTGRAPEKKEHRKLEGMPAGELQKASEDESSKHPW